MWGRSSGKIQKGILYVSDCLLMQGSKALSPISSAQYGDVRFCGLLARVCQSSLFKRDDKYNIHKADLGNS